MMLTIEGMLDMLERLKRLPEDWDGENSPKITPDAINSCQRLIQEFKDLEDRPIKIGQMPIEHPSFLYPYTGGGLSFRWEKDNFNRIIIKPDGSVVESW